MDREASTYHAFNSNKSNLGLHRPPGNSLRKSQTNTLAFVVRAMEVSLQIVRTPLFRSTRDGRGSFLGYEAPYLPYGPRMSPSYGLIRKRAESPFKSLESQVDSSERGMISGIRSLEL